MTRPSLLWTASFLFGLSACQTQPAKPQISTPIEQLSAERTAWVISFEPIQDLPSIVEHLLDLDLSQQSSQLFGIDWHQPTFFSNFGIAGNAALSLFWDQKLNALCAIGTIVDRTAFEQALFRFEGTQIQKLGGQLETLHAFGKDWILGQRAPYTLACQLDPQTQSDDFHALLNEHTPTLAQLPQFKQLFTANAGIFSYIDIPKTLQLTPMRSPTTPVSLTQEDRLFYAKMFPSFSFTLHKASEKFTLNYSEDAFNGLKKLLKPNLQPADFTRYFSQDTALAMRFGVNLDELIMGIKTFLPPSQLSMSTKIDLVDALLPMLTGISRLDIAAAFTGHFAFASQSLHFKAEDRTPPFLFLAGLKDKKACEQMFDRMLASKKSSGLAQTPLELNGHQGFTLSLKNYQFYILIESDILLISTSRERLEEAIKKPSQLPTKWEKALKDDALYVSLMQEPGKDVSLTQIFLQPDAATLTVQGSSLLTTFLKATFAENWLQMNFEFTPNTTKAIPTPSSAPSSNDVTIENH